MSRQLAIVYPIVELQIRCIEGIVRAQNNKRYQDILRLLPLIWRFVCDAFHSGPGLTVAILLLRLLRAGLPLAIFWLPKLILDALLLYVREAGAGSAPKIFNLVALQLGLVLFNDVLGRVGALCEGLLGERFTNSINERLIAHATSLDFAYFETPPLYDKLERARNQAAGRLTLLMTLLNVLQELGTLAALLLGFTVLSKGLVVLLVIAIVPSLIHEPLAGSIRHNLLHRLATQRRELDYFKTLGTTKESAKEIRVLGLRSYVSDNYTRLAKNIYGHYARASMKRAMLGAGINVLTTCSYFSAYVWSIWRVMVGAIGLGTFAFIAQSFSRSLLSIERATSGINSFYENALVLSDLFEFFALRPTIEGSTNSLSLSCNFKRGVEFREVTFKYPGTDAYVLQGVNFTIAPGERVALVGENASGKSTITKLLTRLYDPTEGVILLDGVDVRRYELDSLRQQIAILFQDFVKFDMCLRENVALGSLKSIDNDDELNRALELSGASEIIRKLPKGLEQMLGRRFEGGIDLSGGEWQRVSLARAAMRDASILILDEPSASLDSHAENKLFQHFHRLAEGKTVLLITHKLATTRTADRIFVMSSGRIEEIGTHEELIAQNGRYAELYELQAASFR